MNKVLMKSLIHDESGAAATEYALIAGLIAVAIIASLTALGTEIAEIFTGVQGRLEAVEVPDAPAEDTD